MGDLLAFLVTNLPSPIIHHIANNGKVYVGAWHQLLHARDLLFSAATPVVDRILQSPDLTSLLLLVVVLFVSIKVLGILWRTLLFWLRLAMNLLFWGSLALFGLWMYSRGFDGAAQDVKNANALWTSEYQKWKQQDDIAMQWTRQQALRGQGGGGGGGGAWF